MTLGGSALGGAALSGGTVSQSGQSPPVSIPIGSDDHGNIYDQGSLSVSDQLNGRNTCELRLIDKGRTVKVAAGKPITIWFHGIRVFSGTVERAREIVDIGSDEKTIQVNAVDFNQLADRFRLFGSFESVVMELEAPSELETVSDSVDDTTQTVTVEGLDDNGAVVTSTKTLSGTTPVRFDGVYLELTRIAKSANTKGTVNVRVAVAGATIRNLGPELNEVLKQVILLSDAVEDIVNLLTPLASEGVTVTGVQADDATIITKLRMSGQKASEVFDSLAEHFGWVWYIDYDKVLHFHDRSIFRAPTGFGDQSGDERRFRAASYETDRGEYRNRQFLRAGKDRVGEDLPSGLVETAKGDGETRSFLLQMDVAGGPDTNDKPRLQVVSGGVTTTVPASKLGLQGRDDQDALVGGVNSEPIFHWFYAPGSDRIQMNPNLKSAHVAYPVPLGTADTLRINYYGEIRLLVQADNIAEQDARKAVEGGGGLYEEMEQDETVDGLSAAIERAQGILARRDQIFDTISIETHLLGYAAGQMIPLDFDDYGISGDFLIDRVQIRDLEGLLLLSRIEAINHDLAASDFQLWKKLARQGQRPFILRENERLHILRKFSESISLSEISSVQSGDFLDPEIDDESALQEAMLQHGGIMNGGEEF